MSWALLRLDWDTYNTGFNRQTDGFTSDSRRLLASLSDCQPDHQPTILESGYEMLFKFPPDMVLDMSRSPEKEWNQQDKTMSSFTETLNSEVEK